MVRKMSESHDATHFDILCAKINVYSQHLVVLIDAIPKFGLSDSSTAITY